MPGHLEDEGERNPDLKAEQGVRLGVYAMGFSETSLDRAPGTQTGYLHTACIRKTRHWRNCRRHFSIHRNIKVTQ
jgi:hypothetical protein